MGKDEVYLDSKHMMYSNYMFSNKGAKIGDIFVQSYSIDYYKFTHYYKVVGHRGKTLVMIQMVKYVITSYPDGHESVFFNDDEDEEDEPEIITTRIDYYSEEEPVLRGVGGVFARREYYYKHNEDLESFYKRPEKKKKENE